MKLIWAVSLFVLTNIKVYAASNIVNCNTYEEPDKIAQTNYNNRNRYYYEYQDPPKPLYSYGICDKVILSKGTNLKFSKTSIKYILFQNSRIGTIPPRIFQSYPSLEIIYINNSYVSEIDLNAFANLGNLKQLFLENNELEDIGKGIYNNLQDLQILDISNNRIKTIEEKAFSGLIYLQNLNLSYNKIQDISLDIFDSELYSLHSLNFSHNILSKIDIKKISNLFNADSKTSQIDLSYNALKSFNFSQLTCNLNKLNLRNNNLNTLINLQNSKTINELDLSNNNLSEFNYAPKNMKYLNLSGNVLKNLNISMISNEAQIETLDVSQNLINYLSPCTFYNMSTMKNLNLANNNLTELPIGVFKNVTLLSSLNLSGNQLQRFEYGTFSGLEKLTELDISNNSFYFLDAKVFYVLKNLIRLNIASNKLTTLNPYNILNHCENLKVVILNNNPWICESLLNLSSVLKKHQVEIPDGQNLNIKNHLGHSCHEPETLFITESPVITYSSLENKINSLEKTIKIEFQNYENHSSQRFSNYETLNEYFNKDFKSTEFYKYFNQDFSKKYENSVRNFTETLNLIALKFNQIGNNFEKFDQAVDKFLNFFDNGFKKSKFYEYFDNNFANLMKNVKATNYSDDDMRNYFYKIFVSKATDQNLPTTKMQLSSNISYAKLTNIDVQEKKGVEQEIASLSNLFIVFASITIPLLTIITFLLFLIFKNFVCNRSKEIKRNSELVELQLV